MSDCLFCRIIKGDIPSQKIYEDDFVYAFPDIAPHAPTHILVVPKHHVKSMDELSQLSDEEALALFRVLPKIAAQAGLTNGYRVVANIGADAQQSVGHLHIHILGGKLLGGRMD